MLLPPRSSAFLISLCSTLLISCSAVNQVPADMYAEANKADSLFIIDCLLPGQVRKLGQNAMYLTARRPIKTTASECAIRGGEYVAYDRADFRTSLNVWLPQAKGGNAEAQAFVGEIYEKGMGVPPNYNLAKQWYEKAAAQKNTKAQLNLGYLYEKGLGVPKSLPTAMSWYQKASGLEDINIPYAATLNAAAENSGLKEEVKLLKASLHNSRQASDRLTSELAQSQQQITQQQINLDQSSSTLSKYKKQLNSKLSSSNNTNSEQLKSIISKKESEIQQQKSHLAKSQQHYDEKLNALSDQLASTQKRAEQISNELQKTQSPDISQNKLLNTEALLAKTQAHLVDLQRESQQQLHNIHTENMLLKKQHSSETSRTTQELEITQQELIQQRKDKFEQELALYQLKQTNSQYQHNITQLKAEIKNTDTSKARQRIASQKLTDYNKAVKKSQGQILTLQKQLKSTEQQLSTLKSNSDTALSAALADKSNSSKAQQAKIKQQQNALLTAEKRIVEYETKWQQQQALTKQLINEKERYQAELKGLNKTINLSSLDNNLAVEIIDPPMVLVRGTPTISLRSIVQQREIFGKVTTSTGLLSLLVNDHKTNIDAKGLFQANIRLSKTENPVNIVAIDKSGKRANLEFILSLDKARKLEKSSTIIPPPKKTNQLSWKKLNFGRYHALIIGNNDYKKVPSLDTPINDAKAVAQVLKQHYKFDSTQLLLNATRYEILSALNKLRSELTEDDNLIIYYAGHGELDKTNMRGHWLPVDADADNTANWISTVAITDILNSMTAKHVMIVSDSCYSGAMTRSSLARIDAGTTTPKKQQWLKAMLKTRSRTVLTSGGLKPVMDGGGGKHSVFAKAFLEALRSNTGLLEGQDLYREVSGNIISIASEYGIDQVPEYAPIRHAGHESGEFFLIPKV